MGAVINQLGLEEQKITGNAKVKVVEEEQNNGAFFHKCFLRKWLGLDLHSQQNKVGVKG